MNNSNASSVLNPEQQSLKDLDSQFLINIFAFTVLTALTVASNFGVVFGVYKGGDQLRSNHYKILVHACIVASVLSLYVFVTMGFIRIVYTLNRIPDNGTVLRCAMMFLVFEAIMAVDQYNVFVLAFDRFLAVTFPFTYKRLKGSRKYLIGSLAIPWSTAWVEVAAKFILYTKDFGLKPLSVCLVSNTRTQDYLTFRFGKGIFVGATTISLYILAILIAQYKLSKNTGSSRRQTKKEIGFKLMLTCGMDALIYTCTFFVGNIYQTVVVAPSSASARIILAPLGLMFIILSTTPRFFVNYGLNKEFKKQILKYCCCGKVSTVGIISTTQLTTSRL